MLKIGWWFSTTFKDLDQIPGLSRTGNLIHGFLAPISLLPPTSISIGSPFLHSCSACTTQREVQGKDTQTMLYETSAAIGCIYAMHAMCSL